MKTLPRRLALMLALAWLGGGAARAQTPIYTANATTAVPQTGAVHVLQIITLSQGPGIYSISTVGFGAYFAAYTTQSVYFYFYSGVDSSAGSSDALGAANYFTYQSGDCTPRADGTYPAGYFFTYTPTPFTVTTDSTGSIAVEIQLLEPDPAHPGQNRFSTNASNRFTASAPTVGAAPGYVWNDANRNLYFTGAEQTRFGMANANLRMAFTGTLIQPASQVKTYTRSGATTTLTVDGYTGVSYQLQRATSLVAADWTNLGSAVDGSNGTPLTFTDTDSADPAAFYRVTATLSTDAARGVGQGVSRPVAGVLRFGGTALGGRVRPDPMSAAAPTLPAGTCRLDP